MNLILFLACCAVLGLASGCHTNTDEPHETMPKTRIIQKISIGLVLLIIGFSTYTYFRISINQNIRKTACFEDLVLKLENDIPPELIFQDDFDKLQLLVEYSLVARAEMLEVSTRLRLNKDEPLSSRDLLVLKTGMEDYLEIREELYDLGNSYECAVDVEDSTLLKYDIDPKLRLKGLMLSLAAALTLYDNYLLAIVLFEQDERLRNILNDPDMGFGLVSNKLAEMTLAANSIEYRHRVRRAINFFENEKHTIRDAHEDSEYSYLLHLIESSPSLNYAKKIRLKEIATNKFVTFERISADLVSEVKTSGLDVVSGWFGNTVGLFESRKGKLYGNSVAKMKIQSVLQPLDILLEKTPFRLTDKLIPGYFGHVAIWTGTKTELIERGVWDEMHIKQYADQISMGSNPDTKDAHQIIEAVRSGVKLSTLDQFMNVDDLAILRPVFEENSRDELTREALIMAFRQIGKKYDFNFDVNTTDKIVCSELAYVSFPSIDWPTEKMLGKYAISPDNVAQMAWTSLPLKLVLFYHDGQLVDEDKQVEEMMTLMK